MRVCVCVCDRQNACIPKRPQLFYWGNTYNPVYLYIGPLCICMYVCPVYVYIVCMCVYIIQTCTLIYIYIYIYIYIHTHIHMGRLRNNSKLVHVCTHKNICILLTHTLAYKYISISVCIWIHDYKFIDDKLQKEKVKLSFKICIIHAILHDAYIWCVHRIENNSSMCLFNAFVIHTHIHTCTHAQTSMHAYFGSAWHLDVYVHMYILTYIHACIYHIHAYPGSRHQT